MSKTTTKRAWKSHPRRRNYPWSPQEISKLIEWNTLEFVPSSPDRALKRVSIPVQRELAKKFRAGLGRDLREWIDATMDDLSDRSHQLPPLVDLPRWMVNVLIQFKSETGRLTQIRRAYSYLAARLGYAVAIPLLGIATSHSGKFDKSLELSLADQRELLLDWTELYEHLWTDRLWRNSLRLRYEMGDRIALRCLSPSVRQRLERAANLLLKQYRTGSVPKNVLAREARKANAGRDGNSAKLALSSDYLTTLVSGGIGSDHWLQKPISSSGFFERIAEPGLGFSDLHEKLQETFRDRFCRYLSVPSNHPDGLLGKILYHLVQLDWEPWERPPKLPPLGSIRWPVRKPISVDSLPRDFYIVARRYSRELRIPMYVFRQIWRLYSELTSISEWQQWSNVQLKIFWAARLLEEVAPETFREFGRRIDDFHVNVVKPLLSKRRLSKPEAAQLDQLRDTFGRDCIFNPLLNAVLHTEIFDGRKMLTLHPSQKKEDFRVLKLMIAYTDRRLRQEHAASPPRAIEQVLPDTLSLSPHVRNAREPRDRQDRLNPKRRGFVSHHAYTAPLIAAMFNDPTVPLSPEYVEEIWVELKADVTVERLVNSSLWGRTPPVVVVLPPNGR